MVIKSCQSCGESFSYEPCLWGGREMFPQAICEPCDTRTREAGEQQRRADSSRRREEQWARICPPLYRTTDPARIPSPFATIAQTWAYSPKGLGLVGAAGQCKTRAAFLVLHRQFLAGRSCQAVNSTRLAMLCADQFSDTRSVKEAACNDMSALRCADVLLIDDLGKSKMTERCEMELFDILEHRTSHLAPTIWTANASGNQLLALMSPDRGEPILRRLAEFSEIVTA